MSGKKNKTVKTPTPSKSIERKFGEANINMIDLMSNQYENQVLKALSAETVAKFTDAKEGQGNYARRFKRLSIGVRKKLMRRFSNIRIERMAKDFLEKSDRETSAKLYKAVEAKVGIPAKQLALKEATNATRNALILETATWMQKLRDETLELYTANTLRAMTQGTGIEDIMADFAKLKEKRKNHAKFTARNQINNFNSIMTKTRAKKIGITRARWVTSGDERVRGNPSGASPNPVNNHYWADGKEFDLDKGLKFPSGNTLLPATDYQCRCTYELIIEGEDE